MKEPISTDKVGILSDRILQVLLVGMVFIPLFGIRGCAGVASMLGLGPGWPEILQGATGLLCLVGAGARAVWLKRRSQ